MTLGAEDYVLRHLGQQALYPDLVAPPSQHHTWKVLSSSLQLSTHTTPYRCHLSSETIQTALNAAVAETREPPDDWENKREWLIEEVLGKLKEPIDVVHRRPTVHAELAMIIAIVKGDIKDVLPYVGVPKLSCTMCSHYIGVFNKVWKQKIVTKGSHGKAYPGWFRSNKSLYDDLRSSITRGQKPWCLSVLVLCV